MGFFNKLRPLAKRNGRKSKSLGEDAKRRSWERLTSGSWASLGRSTETIDLTDFEVGTTRVTERIDQPIPVGAVQSLMVEGRRWRGVDFSRARFHHLRLSECDVSSCTFDSAVFDDLRIWNSSFVDVSFQRASLRSALLGGVADQGEGCRYDNVDFSFADLRRSIYAKAHFENCKFTASRLDHVEFRATTFENCTFEGGLRSVNFHGLSPLTGEGLAAVDFSRARLSLVEFRGLSLNDVKLPADADHVVVTDMRRSLDVLIELFAADASPGCRALTALLKHKRKWLPECRTAGVHFRPDIRELCGADVLDKFDRAVQRTRPLARPPADLPSAIRRASSGSASTAPATRRSHRSRCTRAPCRIPPRSPHARARRCRLP